MLVLTIGNTSYSQREGERDIMEYAPHERICSFNSVAWKSEIHLASSKIVHFRFENDVRDDVYLRESNTKNDILRECSTLKNEVTFHISNTRKSYELITMDDCGNEVIISQVNDEAKSNFDPKAIEISELLSPLIQDFGFGNNKICAVFNEDKSVPLAEKISFYQKYIMKGRSYNKSINGSCDEVLNFLINNGFPNCDDDGPGDGGDDPVDYECNCSTLTVVANHEKKGPVTQISKYASSVESENVLGDNAGVQTDLSNGGKKWEYYTVKGASTWHGAYTTGWKEQEGAKDSIVREVGDLDDLNTTPLRGTLVLYLLCTEEELPSECGCDKPVTVNFTYESYVDVEAVNRDSWGDKSSIACAQDLGIAYCFQPSSKEDVGDIANIIPVAALNTSACASCEDTVNPEYWGNWRNLAANLINLFTDGEGHTFTWDYEYEYDSTLIQIDTLQMVPIILDSIYRIDTILVDSTANFNITNESQAYIDLANDVFDIVETNYYLDRECGSAVVHKLIENTYKTTLRPNLPLTLGVLGKHKLMAGGSRSWYSHAALATNFNISAVVEPGDFSGPEADCCSPWLAAYIMGTSLPGDSENYRSNVGSDIKAYGPVFSYGNPNGLEGSGFSNYSVRGDMGYMTKYLEGVEGCVTVGKTSQLNAYNEVSTINDLSKAVIKAKQLDEINSTISIYTIDGKRVFESFFYPLEYKTETELQNFLSNILQDYQLGLYIVQLKDNRSNISFKHINRL